MSRANVLLDGEPVINVICDWCQTLLCDPEGTEYYDADDVDQALKRNGWHTDVVRGIRCDMCNDCWDDNTGGE